jgi:hypothetical protein
MINLFRRKNNVQFTEDNVGRFTELLTEIYVILRDNAYSHQAECIMQILTAVQKQDADMFKQKVISTDMLGGAGSVIDVSLCDEEIVKRFYRLINDFLKLTLKAGLNHRAIKSRITKE